MDLGIRGKNAIICASSRGLGKACALSLAINGVNVVLNGRDEKVLNNTKNEILDAAPNVKVNAVACDVSCYPRPPAGCMAGLFAVVRTEPQRWY